MSQHRAHKETGRQSGRRLEGAAGGNVAMIYALSVFALVTLVGIGIDLSRGFSERHAVQTALDAAALAGARKLEDASATDAEIITVARTLFAQNLFTAHGDLVCAPPAVVVDRTAGRVDVSADCDLPTTIASLVSVSNMDIGANAGALANMTRLDLALMLDVSGSMSGTKIADLRAAAKEAADILITDTSGDRVRLAFNTYATAVNAGAYASAVKGPSYVAGQDCVSERAGSAAFKDDEPGIGKWLGQSATACPKSSVLPLTSDRAAFKTAIDGLTAGGATAGHIGVAWAWYLIAPDWDDVWPAASAPLAYGAPRTIKAVVLMTDGMFNTQYESAQGDSATQAKKLCKKMREEGVLVYAVAFKAPASAKAVLKNCTGDDTRFFDAGTGTELKAAYRAIASQLSNLRLAD